GTTVSGDRTFASQSYDRAENIYLRVTDGTGELAYSGVIVVLPAPAAVLDLWVEDLPGHELDFPLRPNDTVMVHVRTTDSVGNPVRDVPLQVQVINGDGGLGSTKAQTFAMIADIAGRGSVELSVHEFGTQDIRLQAVSNELLSSVIMLEVIGPPATTLSLDPVGAVFRDGYYVTPNTEISLSAVTEDPGGIQAIFVDVDILDPPRPTDIFTGPFTLADLGPEYLEPGTHTLRFFAEESSGVVEPVRTVTLYTAKAMDTDRDITNRPNPFNPSDGATMIMFRPTASGNVTMTIYDLYGDVVHSEQQFVTAGEVVQIPWNGTNGKGHKVANGGYICRVQGNGMDLRRKVAVVK
ncbi:MAG: FlgD immunoglobulin-like domain containing protein, partial [Candidatus Krumholzibacteria bacterium]|nr:FlgD immunoglobulin-like domain containing protein [Candidatus Krumholzibacteria bacterium]